MPNQLHFFTRDAFSEGLEGSGFLETDLCFTDKVEAAGDADQVASADGTSGDL